MTPFAKDVIAEARRLHNIGRVMDGEVACIGTLQALKFSVREVVDLIFAPTAKPYDAPGGLKEILLAHPGNARTFGVSEWNEIRATI